MPIAHVVYEKQGPVARLTFNRPEARNAMTWEMYEALADACDRVDRDDEVRVFVLRGTGGKAFVAGTDISQFQSFSSGDDGVRYEQRLGGVIDRLDRVTKPTIAQVQGVAAGGGCAIVLACDLCVASPDSTFGFPISRTLGNCLSVEMCSRLVDVIGPRHVKDLLFTGRLIPADEACAIGLVNRVVAAGDLEQGARELALGMTANAPLTIRATKEMVRRILERRRLTAAEDAKADADLLALCYGSADFREGVSSFLAKRPPQWSGR